MRKLLDGKATDAFINKMVEFFETLQRSETEGVRLGHAYFLKCINEKAAADIWSLRIKPTLRRACRLNQSLFKELETNWLKVVTVSPENGVQVDEQVVQAETTAAQEAEQ